MVRPQEGVRLLLQVVRAQDLDNAVSGRQLLDPGGRVSQAWGGHHPFILLRPGGVAGRGSQGEAAQAAQGDASCGGKEGRG